MREFISLSNYLFKYIFICCLLGVFVIAFGQESIENENYVPSFFGPSPNVMEMNKYLDQPVNYSTGIPEISIPLYNINFGDIYLPINLSYHAGGVKVNQEATIVGLGWTLSVGGSVSREIRGIVDDHKSDYDSRLGGAIYATKTLKDKAEILNDEDHPEYDVFNLAVGESDSELDLFYLNFPEGSSQFIFNQDEREFNELNKSNNKIEYFHSNSGGMRIHQWRVTSPKGVIYNFGEENASNYSLSKYLEKNDFQIQYNNSVSPANNDYKGVSTWFLNNIIDKKGNEVKFEYRTNDNVIHYNALPITTYNGNLPVSGAFYTKKTVHEKVIDKIIFDLGRVEFKYSDEFREDLENSRFLEKIIVYDNYDNIIRQINFNYSYFESINSTGVPTLVSKSFSKKRLKLNSVVIKGSESDSLSQIYAFDYEDTPLPPKHSYAQDYWGGYNGVIDNQSLVPSSTVMSPNSEGPFYDYLTTTGAIRNVDKDYVTAAVLNKITYPTGGYTIYDYEPNTASDLLMIDELVGENNSALHLKNIKNPYHLSNYSFSGYDENENNQNLDCEKVIMGSNDLVFRCSFNISNPLQSPIIIKNSSVFNCPENSTTSPGSGFPAEGDPPLCNFLPAYIKRANDAIGYGNRIDNGNWVTIDPIHNSNDSELELIVPFNGTIELFESSFYEPDDHDRAYFTAYIDVKEDIDPINKYVGGLRVREIKKYNSNGELISYRNYEYEFEENGKTISSGLTMLPQFSIYDRLFFYLVIGDGNVISGHFLFDHNINYLSNNSTYYKKIRENTYDINSAQNIKYTKEYFFTNNTYRFSGENIIRETTPLIKNAKLMDVSWSNYLEEAKTKNISEDIVFEENFVQTLPTEDDEKIIFSGHKLISLSVDFPQNQNYLVIDYNTYSGFSNNTLHKTKEYFGNSVLENQVMTKYEGANKILPSITETTNSLGETLKTEYKYPQDLTSNYEQSSMMQELVDRNIISTPVITKTSNDGIVTSEQRIRYGGYIGNILPSSIYAKKGEMNANVDLDDRKITYDLYDPKGNLMQYTTENGTPVSIIWGYNGQYPIAKVEGKSYGSISTLANNLISKSNNNNLSANDFESLRTLNDAIVTGYIYKPLVGVTKIIHPNGQKEIYEYDEAGRLEKIKDHNGNVLKEIEYNYQNQP